MPPPAVSARRFCVRGRRWQHWPDLLAAVVPAIMAEEGGKALNLFDKFVELSLEGYLPLEEFLERVAAEEFGPVSKEELRKFLQDIEQNTLNNIEAKLEENPELGHLREEKIAETEAKFARLREKYLDSGQ